MYNNITYCSLPSEVLTDLVMVFTISTLLRHHFDVTFVYDGLLTTILTTKEKFRPFKKADHCVQFLICQLQCRYPHEALVVLLKKMPETILYQFVFLCPQQKRDFNSLLQANTLIQFMYGRCSKGRGGKS